MRYGGGLQEGAVPLRLAHYPPVITCFRSFLGAQGASETPPQGKPAATRTRHGGARRSREMERSRSPRAGGGGRWERQAARRRAAVLEKALGGRLRGRGMSQGKVLDRLPRQGVAWGQYDTSHRLLNRTSRD